MTTKIHFKSWACLLLFLPMAAWAGGMVTNCTESDLRTAMAGGGVVTFACDGTIFLANTITNDSDTTLDGGGHHITISGNSAVRVFCVDTNVNFTVVNLTIADGTSKGGSAMLNLAGTVNLSGVTLRSNTASFARSNEGLGGGGGAIFNRGGTVSAANCSFANNIAQTLTTDHAQAWVYGGAIRNESGQVALRSCSFVANRASGAAGFSYLPPADPGLGGAIHNSGTLTLDLCTLSGNSASGGAGAGNQYGFEGGPGGEGSGGAIFNEGTLTASRTTLRANAATGGSGGAGSSSTGPPELNGYPGGDGGGAKGAAICNSGSLWVTQSTFDSNVATGGAGGAGGFGGEVMDIGGNGGSGGSGGSGLGGGLFNSGAASLVNCTIAFNGGSGGNGADGGGGQSAVYAGSGGAGGWGGSGFGGVDGTCNLTNCTIAWNVGNGGLGGAGGAGGFSTQHPGAPGAPGLNGSAWGGTACATLPNTLIASNTPPGGDSFPDPKLGPLANNSGPTLTMALLPSSPAIDAGNSAVAPVDDQRGFPRPAGLAADLGAFEYGSVMPLLTISPSGATGLQITAYGNAGRSCRLLRSADMSNWVPIATNQLSGDGTYLFQDTCAPGGDCRFYRLVMP